MRRVVVGYICVGLALVLVLGGFFFLQKEGFLTFGDLPFTGFASDGQAFLCINSEPIINVSACPTIMNQSTRILDNTESCVINASDGDGDTLLFSVLASNSWFWIDENSGLLTLRPFQNATGNQNIIIFADDNASCSNSVGSAVLSVNVLDINDPPQLIANVTNVEFAQRRSLSPYSLYTFFDDPDDDALTFSVLGNSIASISITQSTGAVFFSATSCGTDYVLFRATDPFNESAESGVVTVRVTCVTPPQDQTSGSGGGGGSSFSSNCTPKWKCNEWSDCLINGSRVKECVDLHGCTAKYQRNFWEECTYIPTCFDGVKNQGELGIDCGGPCRPCGTCFDGIQNNDEESVDCGGEFCEPCMNCSDGVMNWGELGIDCGGPCSACASCFDGIQNQDETGIDCGGQCPLCVIGETPGVMAKKSPLTLIIMILALLLIILTVLFKFYHKKIMRSFAKFMLYITHQKKKLILLSAEEKMLLLNELTQAKKVIKDMEKPASSCVDMITVIARKYYFFAFDLHEVFDEKDVLEKVSKLPHEQLKNFLSSFFLFVRAHEQSKVPSSYDNALALLEELRFMVLVSSEVKPEDLTFEATEKEVMGSMLERAYALLFNIHLALQFEEGLAAKEHYLQLVSVYEHLSEEEKGLIYNPMIRSYYEIKYVLGLLREG
jgi:hypothetical protein